MFSEPCGGETRPEWDFRGALELGGTLGWLRRTGGPWVQAWTSNNPKMLGICHRKKCPLFISGGRNCPSNYVLDCLGAGCAGGVGTGRRAGGAAGRRTSWAGGGGAVEDLHLLLLPDLHLQRLILLSPKLDASHPVTSGPCCRLTVAALAASCYFSTLSTLAILLTSCCRRRWPFALGTTTP